MRGAAAALLAGLLVPAVAEGGEITLSFGDAPGGAGQGFRIERRPADSARFQPIALVGPGIAEFVDRGLPDGATYCYRVRASSAKEVSAWSPEVCALVEREEPAPASEPARAGEPAPPVAPAPAPIDPAATPVEPATEPADAPRRIRTSGGWLQVLD